MVCQIRTVVLQLNADGLEDHSDIISAATDVIDNQTTISF
jgi:hypothetical protein